MNILGTSTTGNLLGPSATGNVAQASSGAGNLGKITAATANGVTTGGESIADTS
jgi:hypothetical protein